MKSAPATSFGHLALVALWFGSSFIITPANATDSGPAPLIEFALGLPGKQVKLSWSGEPGLRYHVEKSTNLGAAGGAGDGWQRVAVVDGAGPTVEWRDPQAVTERCFYRVTKPQAEVFSIEPPVLSAAGGSLWVRGQCLPAGSVVELRDEEGHLVASFPLIDEISGLWRADVAGTFPPGEWLTATVVGSGIPTQGSMAPVAVTLSGYAMDAPASMPSAAPISLGASKPVPGIGVIVKKHPPSNPPGSHTLSGGFWNDWHDILVSNSGNGPNDDVDQLAEPTDDIDLFIGPNDDSDSLASPTDDFDQLVIPNDDVDLLAMPTDDSDISNDRFVAKTSKDVGWLVNKQQAGNFSMRPASSGLPGEVSFHFDALSLPNPAGPPLAWVMTYRSSVPVSSGHGPQWDFSYNISIEAQPPGSGSSAARVVVRDGGGRADVFHRQADGTYRCAGLYRQGRFSGDTFTLSFADQGKWVFKPLGSAPDAGKIASITDRNNVSLTCDYDSSGLLSSVNDGFGRSLNVTWDATGGSPRISSVADSSGRAVHFAAYASGEGGGAEGTLKSISCPQVVGAPPEAAPFVFNYTSGKPDPNLNHNLLSVTDGVGRLLEAFTYHSTSDSRSIEYDRCATHDRHGDGHVTVLKSAPNSQGGCTLYEVDELGRLTETDYDRQHRLLSIRRHTGFCTPGLAADASTNRPIGKLRPGDPDFYESQYSWNPDHALTQITDPDGSQLRFVHEREFRPGGPVTESGNVRSVTLRSSTGQTRVVSFEYLPGYGTLEAAMPGGPIKGIQVKCGRNPGGDIIAQGKSAGAGGKDACRWDSGGPCRQARAAGTPSSPVMPTDDYDSLINPIAMDKGLRRSAVSSSLVSYNDDCDDVASTSVAKVSQGATFGERLRSGFHSVLDMVNGSGGPENPLSPRVSRIVAAHGHAFGWTFDGRGNPSSATMPFEGSGTSFQHDSFGRCTSVTITDESNSFVTEIAYDPSNGMPSALSIDPGNLNLTTQFHYDALGRCIREVDPGGFDTLFEYLPSGRISRCESPPIGSNRIATSLHYDQASRLVRCDVENRSPDGKFHASNPTYSTFFVYDGRGRLIRTAREERPVAVTSELTPDSLGIENFAVIDLQINPAGEITRVSTPAACRGSTEDLVCDYQYDERGLLYRRIPGGLGTAGALVDQIDYASNGLPSRVARLQDFAASREASFGFEAFQRISVVTDSMGNRIQFSYDDRGGVTREVYGELIDVPGSAGNVLLSRKKHRHPTQLFAHNIMGRLSFSGSGSTTSDVLIAQDPSAVVKSLFHQWPNRDEEITEERFIAGSSAPPVVETTIISRSPAGLLKQVTRNGDLLATFTHDSAGRTLSCSSAARTVTVTRDSRGNPLLCGNTNHFRVGSAPSKTFTLTHQYDALGRRVQSSDSSGNTISRAFDSLGRLYRMTASTGMVVSCDYDGATATGPYSRRICKDLDADGSEDIVISELSRCGEWKSSTDALGHVTSATHDALGRLSRVDFPEGTYQTWNYNSLGFQHSARLSDGSTRDTGHDLNGRVISISSGNLPAGVTPVVETTYRYDGLGRMVRCNQGSSTIILAWDSLGARVSETQGDFSVSSTYNHRGRTGLLTSVQAPYELHIAENRDSLGRVISVSLVDATGTMSPPVASFEHLGHQVSRSIAGNGVSTAYTFRGDGEVPVSGDRSYGMQPVRCVVTDGSGAVLSDSSVSRDAAQLATSISTQFSSNPAGASRTTSLARDGLGRVTGWTSTRRNGAGLPPVVENEVSYTLDARGDRILVFGGQDPGSYTQSSALPPGDAQRGLYTTWPRGTLEWDANRNLTRIPYADVTHTMQYDALGRLVSINNEATGSPLAEYSYDGLNRLLTLTVHGGSVPHFTRFIYDGSVCVQELGGDGVADLTYVVSGGIRYCTSTRNGTIYYPHRSNLTYIGPCDASEVITSATGSVVEHRTCDGEGRAIYLSPDGLPSSTGTSVTPIRWTAPECLNVPNTRTCTCGTGDFYFSSLRKGGPRFSGVEGYKMGQINTLGR